MAPMGFLDDAKKKLGDAVDKHGDKIGDGLDKAAKLADEKTKGKYSDKIDFPDLALNLCASLYTGLLGYRLFKV